jgi:hypothetical protein
MQLKQKGLKIFSGRSRFVTGFICLVYCEASLAGAGL